MSNAMMIDEKVLGECLNEISHALLQSDVRKIVNLETLAAGTNKWRIIQQAVFTELCNMLDPGKLAFNPKKGKSSVVMFVGLQGQSDSPTNLACLLCLLFYTYY
ncbi:signal recognition particle 54 kDa protein 2-like [Triticum dicoccoides]|uniref:signal recognition particle 54 kDa protein 2-like n=1 Tax=Triticum dicoccoides TaxID=85692 RepID=UPI00188DF3C9|nr:signal recognition particle 54 kDa protein 2-like [Triticum dicoccoides]